MKRLSFPITIMLVVMAFIPPAQAASLLGRSGKITFLRVHDVGTGWGPSRDFLNVEVVIKLQGHPGAYGFQLRNDHHRPVRQGMLDLLRDAFNNNWTVTINYFIEPPKVNGRIIRVWLTKPGHLLGESVSESKETALEKLEVMIEGVKEEILAEPAED